MKNCLVCGVMLTCKDLDFCYYCDKAMQNLSNISNISNKEILKESDKLREEDDWKNLTPEDVFLSQNLIKK